MRLNTKTLLDNKKRKNILYYLCEHKYASDAEISEALGMSQDSVKYHMDVLYKFDMVSYHFIAGRVRWCITGNAVLIYDLTINEQFDFRNFYSEKYRKILDILSSEHWTRLTDIASLSGLSRQLVFTYCKKMENDGFIESEKKGYHKLYRKI
jgi:predicted transcriptional regulator